MRGRLLGALAAGLMPAAAGALTLDMVTVGDPGNANDSSDGNLFGPGVQNYGGVPYAYSVGKYEVRNSEYAEFLNAVADIDTYGLYNTGMSSDARGGISRSGSSESYTYSVKANMGDKPVNYVSFYDAVRFVNWLENGQLTGAQGASTTETGSYTLFTSGSTTTNVSGRGANATWVIPTENEWYKAAYFDPGPEGPSDDYWLYPTRSDSAPIVATANTAGNISNPGANVANFDSGADWNGQNGNVTTAGSAGASSASYYGTFDQGGNVWEWNETIINVSERGVRGGDWNDLSEDMMSSFRYRDSPSAENENIGFRVAMIPEPSCAEVVLMAASGLCVWRSRKRSGRTGRS